MNTSLIHFEPLKSTNDLVNGLAITLTSSDKDFGASSALTVLPEIIQVFYRNLGINPANNTLNSRPPTEKQATKTLSGRHLVSAFAIAPNLNESKYHIHGFIYGIHNHSKDLKGFITSVDADLKTLRPLSKKNSYSVLMKPICDPIDADIRSQNSYRPLIDYLATPSYGTFAHYITYHNSRNLIFNYNK